MRARVHAICRPEVLEDGRKLNEKKSRAAEKTNRTGFPGTPDPEFPGIRYWCRDRRDALCGLV